MDTPSESLHTESAGTEPLDEFASAPPSRITLGAIRFVEWLFGPPYFSTGLIWLLSAVIVSHITLELLPQPAAYWIDPGSATSYSFLGAPYRWGIWNIVLSVGYMLAVAFVLGLIHDKPAFAIWLGISLYHLAIMTDYFRCSGVYFLAFETPNNCSAVHTSAILVAGILAGTMVWLAARWYWIPRHSSEQSNLVSESKWPRRLSFTWMGVCVLVVVAVAALAPKPAWEPIQAARVPPARTEAALAYDTERFVAVLFGGTSSWTPAGGWNSINDTWEWNGRDWNQIQPQHSPSPRYSAGMAFDEKRGVTVLFGGLQPDRSGQHIFHDDTWEWNGTDWQAVFPANRPPARQDAVMFFDPVRGTTVIYGGYYFDPERQTNVFFEDAWEWDGTNWQPLVFTEFRRNSSAAVVFDPGRQAPLLLDGEGVWSWQDSRWVPLSFPTNPPGRWNSQMVFDPTSGQVIVFGGFKDQDVFDDTWIYDGDNWKQVISETRPPRRNGHNMFYDHIRGTFVLFGGLDGGTFYNDMWELVQP